MPGGEARRLAEPEAGVVAGARRLQPADRLVVAEAQVVEAHALHRPDLAAQQRQLVGQGVAVLGRRERRVQAHLRPGGADGGGQRGALALVGAPRGAVERVGVAADEEHGRAHAAQPGGLQEVGDVVPRVRARQGARDAARTAPPGDAREALGGAPPDAVDVVGQGHAPRGGRRQAERARAAPRCSPRRRAPPGRGPRCGRRRWPPAAGGRTGRARARGARPSGRAGRRRRPPGRPGSRASGCVGANSRVSPWARWVAVAGNASGALEERLRGGVRRDPDPLGGLARGRRRGRPGRRPRPASRPGPRRRSPAPSAPAGRRAAGRRRCAGAAQPRAPSERR